MNPTPVTAEATSEAASEKGTDNINLLLSYDGVGDRLFILGLKVAILTVLSLGIYRFWGKTEIRRKLWSSVSMLGNRLEYTGTGRELFLGFLIALVIIIPLTGAMAAVEFFNLNRGHIAEIIYLIVVYTILFYLFGFAYYRARRYRLSRTVWRGIRFGQAGSAERYARVQLGYYVLAVLTLGLLWPLAQVRLQAYQINNTYFGNQAFRFDGRAGDMMGKWIIAYLLMPLTLGLSFLWYKAFQLRYFTAKTQFEGLTFEMPARFADLAAIYVPYYLVLAVLGFFITTIGVSSMVTLVLSLIFLVVALPALTLIMVTHRTYVLVAGLLSVAGNTDFDAIIQNAEAAPKTGEGLADALDVGGGAEIGF